QRAFLYAGGAIGLWSTVATVFKLTLRYVAPLELVAFSSLVSFLVLLTLLLFQGRMGRLLSSSPREWIASAALGLLNPYLYYVVLFAAYSRLLGQEALVLNYTWPITLVLLSALLLGQPFGARSLAALLMSFAGVVFIATRGRFTDVRFSDPLGTGLAVGSSLIWALFWIYNLKDNREETVKLCLNFFFGSIYSLVTLLAIRGPLALPQAGWPGIVYVGFFEMGITFVLWLKAMRLARRAALISNLVFLSPFLSLLFLHLILGEELFLSTLLGLVLIVGGILLQRYRSFGPEGAGKG
ncbi:MAG TPA: DMT family transporter, partial [Spirochaetia bacterium]|nr:DMT family transporter [Spirochaetia bacterium]